MSRREIKLAKGQVRRRLIAELAAEEMTRADLARKYDVSGAAITLFAGRHQEQIDACKLRAEDEFAAIAVASKVNRVAIYDQMISDMEDAMIAAGVVSSKRARTIAVLLKNVAEEMGQLPSRSVTHIQGQTIHYTVEGVDLGDIL